MSTTFRFPLTVKGVTYTREPIQVPSNDPYAHYEAGPTIFVEIEVEGGRRFGASTHTANFRTVEDASHAALGRAVWEAFRVVGNGERPNTRVLDRTTDM